MNVCSGLRDVKPKVFFNHHHIEGTQIESNDKKPIQPMSAPDSEVIKVFFMLNSGRHKFSMLINIKISWNSAFSGSGKPKMLFSCS